MESLRERKKHRTRAALEEAALELFERQGFDETTVEEIAAAADVSPRTLFRYFPTKRDLIFGETETYLARLADIVRTRPANEPPLVALAKAYTELMPAIDRELTARRIVLTRSSPSLRRHWAVTREVWAETIATALPRSRGSDSVDSRLELAAGLVQRVVGQALLVWCVEAGSVPLVDVLRDQLNVAAALFADLPL